MSIFAPFLIRAALAGLAVALAAAPLGCMIVWRRMAYFGDAIAHGAILGVALALGFSVSITGGVLVVTALMALAVSALAGRSFAVDTLLGVMAHSALAFGLVAVSFIKGVRIDLMAYLFGDILAVSLGDLVVIWVGALMVLALIAWRWSALLLSSVDPDLAITSGINPRRERLILTLALALVVAVAIKVVGALLISAMLIIPAAAARPLSATPERMALIALVIGAFASLGGLVLAFYVDSPAAPTMVSVAAGLFAVTNILALVVKFRQR
ncbi:MAG: hypothetical protein GY945_02805 [Rhodobacteraceae bacterium]|nr:hypothetical protein [Paracoccaceae bacterium]